MNSFLSVVLQFKLCLVILMSTSTVQRRLGTHKKPIDVDKKPPKLAAITTTKSTNGCFHYGILLPAVAVGLCLALISILLETPIDPEYYSLPSPPKLEGALEQNHILTNANLILKDQIRGPESITFHKNSLFTGTYDGKILEIVNGKIVSEYRLGIEPCGTFETEPTCGRPLGMRFDKENKLIVADAYLGLYRVDIRQKTHEVLIAGRTLIDGKPLAFLNDLDIHPSTGEIIFTDSSTKWDRRHFPYILLEGRGDGRLLSYNSQTREVKVLLDNLHFPNGVQVSPDGTFVIVAELTRCRLIKYYLAGEKRGRSEILSENLPGSPDNVRLSSDGHIWVAFGFVRSGRRFSAFDAIGPHPWLRSLITKLFSAKILLTSMSSFVNPYGLIVKIDQQGRIVQSFHDPTGLTVPDVSEVEESGNLLSLGSYHSRFIAQVKL